MKQQILMMNKLYTFGGKQVKVHFVLITAHKLRGIRDCFSYFLVVDTLKFTNLNAAIRNVSLKEELFVLG